MPDPIQEPVENPVPSARTRGRKILGVLLGVLILLGLLAAGGFWFYQSGRLNQLVVDQMKASGKDYGVRLEIGSADMTGWLQSYTLRNVQIYNLQSGQPIAKLDRLTLRARINDLLALRLRRRITLQQLSIEGLTAWYEVDAQGRSNLDGVRKPPAAIDPRITFDYEDLAGSLRGAAMFYRDARSQMEGSLTGITADANPVTADNARQIQIKLSTGEGSIRREGKELLLQGADFAGRVSATGAQADSLRLRSSIGGANASGRLNDWAKLQYQAEVEGQAVLDEIRGFLALDNDLGGTADFKGRIDGEGFRFVWTGALSARGFQLAALRIPQAQADGVTVHYEGKRIGFTAGPLRAGTLVAGTTRAQDLSVPSMKGEFFPEAKRFSINAPSARIERVFYPQGAAAGIRLQELRATGEGDKLEARGTVAASGGNFDTITIGNADGRFVVDPQKLTMERFQAALFGGSAAGDLTLQFKENASSRARTKFRDLRTNELAAIAKLKDPPLAGTVNGEAALDWPGLRAQDLNGTVNLFFAGQAAKTKETIPVDGTLSARATRGVFRFDPLQLRTPATTVDVTGTLSLNGESDLRFTLASTQAEEIQTIASTYEGAQKLIADYEPSLSGALRADGALAGPLERLQITIVIHTANIGLRGEALGSAEGRVTYTPDALRIENAVLRATDGGTVQLNYITPLGEGRSEGRLDAVIDRIQAEQAARVARVNLRPGFLTGVISGEAHVTGLPDRLAGKADLRLIDGTISGTSLENATANLSFNGKDIRLEAAELRTAQGAVTANGTLNVESRAFQVSAQATKIDAAWLTAAAEFDRAAIGGMIDATIQASGEASGNTDDIKNLQLQLDAQGAGITINGRDAGTLTATARTSPGGRIDAEITTGITGSAQKLTAGLELRQPGRPIEIRSDLANLDLPTLISIFAPGLAPQVSGNLSGTLDISGPTVNAQGETTADLLRGSLRLTDIAFQLRNNTINIATPVVVTLENAQVRVSPVRITGEQTDLRFEGTIALREGRAMNFNMSGTVDLAIFSRLSPDIFTDGNLSLNIRGTGTFDKPGLLGSIDISDGSISTLDAPVRVEEGNGRIALTENSLRLENFTAVANSGTLRASGEMRLAGFAPENWNFTVTASDVDFNYLGARITANADLALNGTPERQTLTGTVLIPAAEYTSDFDTDRLVGGGPGGRLPGGGFPSTGGGAVPPIDLNIRVEAPESFLVRNEQVNSVASALFNIGGTLSNPELTGRATLEGGTIKFRGQQYEITNGTLDLSGQFGDEPNLNLLAEGDVSGYRVYVGLDGPIDELEVTLRSDPQLARAEILSLITTGTLDTGTLNSNELVRSGVSTAASVLSNELISQPVGQEAERLLGLNRFQIDPVLRPNANPAARLTIGRQIARGLNLTFSTSLGSDQSQTLIAEYGLTNRFSVLSSYTQGGSSTQQGGNDNDFTIEIRGRKRFSLGADLQASLGPPPSPPARTTRALSKALPKALVDVNSPVDVRLNEDRLRNLLPVIREGYSRPLTRLGERNLLNYLQERGYFFAEVSSRCEPDTCEGTDLRVLYDVRPGTRYELSDIRLEGTDAVSEKDVKGSLESQESNLLAGVPLLDRLPLIGTFVSGYARGLTSNDRLRNDRETIRRRLIDLGYRGATVESRLAVSPNDDHLVVIFDVEEGPRSTIADIVTRGNTILESSVLRDAIPIEDGAPFSYSRARDGLQNIRRMYAEQGHLDARAEIQLEDLADYRVRLVYEVVEGPRSIVSDVAITGQTFTREPSIRRFIDFQPGDIVTPEKMRRLQRDLFNTGAFRGVEIRPERVPGADESARLLNIQLAEAKPLLLVYGLGYSTDDGPRALGQLTHSNLFGRVNSVTLRLRGSRREQLGELQFNDQRPFGWRWPTTVSVFYNRDADILPFVRRRVTNEGDQQDSSAGRSFGINRFTTFIQTERKLNERNSLRFRYSFENAKLFRLENIPEIEITRNERAIRLGQLAAGFTRDSRDSAINPTTGQLVSADYSFAARYLGGNEAFQKFFTTYQNYRNVKGSVLAFSARIGLAATYSVVDRDGDGVITEPERRLPISERFFAGGATTLRGFRFEQAGPQGILEPRNANELPTLVPLGGDALTVFNFEFRYPLTRRARIVPFYDVGNVFRRVQDISFSGMTHTVGLGFRINTPIGPVGVDYGYLLDPPFFTTATGGVIRQQRGVFHIRIGQSF